MMRLTKYLHSCLLLEKDNFKLLIDPGKFSFAEGIITPQELAGPDAVIVTHTHPDHLDAESLRVIIAGGATKVYANTEVAEALNNAGIESESIPAAVGPFRLESFAVRHEPLLDSPPPEMTGLLIDGKLLNAVDSFEENLNRFAGVEWLVLPVMAPFTTELAVAAYADRIRPKHIIPVHDGYAKPFFLEQRYQVYQQHFEKQGIAFHWLKDPGDGIELDS